MDIGLCVALRDAQKFVDGVPLIFAEYNRGLGKCFEMHPFYERETALGIDGQNLGEGRPDWPQLLITLFEHLAQAAGRGLVSGLFKFVREERRIVTDFVYIATTRPADATK